ncbi:MAG: hypothetical protein FWG99_09710 [Treponema sp.]|nr:hypothetical protein [Treponema sp.]
MKKIFYACLPAFFSAVIFFAPVSLNAFDFGLLLNQSAGYGGFGVDADGDYEVDIIPRLSVLLGDNGDLYLSGGFTAGNNGEDWYHYPELLRSEFSWSFGSSKIKAGRMPFADSLFVAEGLFDGAQLSFDTMAGFFTAGVWYTGLLYKERANIVMTGEDYISLFEELDYSDFSGTYFASRRLMAALGWEHPSIAELVWLRLDLIGQVDLNNRDTLYHSQYLTGKIGIPFKAFEFELGGGLELAQSVYKDDDDFSVGLAGEVGVYWTLPAGFNSLLSFTGRFTSGEADDGAIAAFVPITSTAQGNILKAPLSGLSILSLDYTARLYKTFSMGMTISHFVRSDLATYKSYLGEEDEGYSLGTELFARFLWSPVSDIRLNLGGGVFLPSLGNVATDADPRWRVEMTAILALY